MIALRAGRAAAAPLFALSLWSVSGCLVPNPNHCVNKDGDSACGSGLVCSNGTCSAYAAEGQPQDGCVDPAMVQGEACLCPDGRDSPGCGEVSETSASSTEATSETATETETETSMTGDGDGDGDGDTAPECTTEGLNVAECGMQSAWCVSGDCVDCSDTAAGPCSDLDAAAPVCNAGSCVQCTTAEADACTGITPVCDDTNNTCRACTVHSECGTAGCNYETGACLDEARVWWVDGDNGSDGNDGSETMPFATIGRALMEIGASEEGTVRVKAVVGEYSEQVAIPTSRTVAIIGDGLPAIRSATANTVAAEMGSTSFIDGVRLSQGGSNGVNCDGATLWLDNSWVSSNVASGLRIVTGCEATVRNTMISRHTDTFTPGSEILNAGTLRMSFVTVVAGGSTGTEGDVLECTAGTVEVSNSVLMGVATDRIRCPGATIENSVVNDAEYVGGTNADGGAVTGSWFTNLGAGDLHLAGDGSGTPFGGVASLGADDLQTDFDGDARPAMGFVGADEP